MDLQELIRTVTREVLDQLRQASERPRVLVLAERDESLAARVRELLDEDVEVIFWGEEAGGRPPARYILPRLSCGDMADLAAGKAGGGLAAEVLRLLLAGTAVDVLAFEHREYLETAPRPLCALYESYENALASYGLKALARKRPAAVKAREALVTAAVVERAHSDGASSLLVPVGAKVTPLAAEIAGNLRITILKKL